LHRATTIAWIRSSLTPAPVDGASMCGRFTLFATPVQVADLFGTAPPADLPPRYNIAPTQPVLACRLDPEGKARELVRIRWDLVPSWAKDLSAGAKALNARTAGVMPPSVGTLHLRQRSGTSPLR
jgi:hypothetical protein